MGTPSLVHLIGEWINGDPLLLAHFDICETLPNAGFVWYWCSFPNKTKNFVANRATVGVNHIVANVVDTRVTVMLYRYEYYKFHAAHPMFFQKLRGHIFDMHNRHEDSCQEYLR